MENSLCAVLYEIEPFKYRHPYHKIPIFVSGRTTKNFIKKLRIPSFELEEITKQSIDLNFKAKNEVKIFTNTRTKTREVLRKDKIPIETFHHSFKISSDFTQNLKVRGSSASIIKRKSRYTPLNTSSVIQPSPIHIRIKKLRNCSRYGKRVSSPISSNLI